MCTLLTMLLRGMMPQLLTCALDSHERPRVCCDSVLPGTVLPQDIQGESSAKSPCELTTRVALPTWIRCELVTRVVVHCLQDLQGKSCAESPWQPTSSLSLGL
jgi:hypothetical protein